VIIEGVTEAAKKMAWRRISESIESVFSKQHGENGGENQSGGESVMSLIMWRNHNDINQYQWMQRKAWPKSETAS